VGMMQTGNNGQINVNGQNMTTINQPAGRNNFKYYDMDGVGLGPIPEKSFPDNGRVASPTGRNAQKKIPINGVL